MTSDVSIALLAGGFLLFVVIYFLRRLNEKREISDSETILEAKKPAQADALEKRVVKEKKKPVKVDLKFQFTHSWLITILKGHTSNVLDFDISSSGRHIISVSADRGLFLWKIKDIWQKDRKIIRSAVVYDTASKVKFSPDDKACVVSLQNANTVRVIKIKKEESGYTFPTLIDFPQGSTADIINIGIASTGNYIMTCHSNTTVIVWSLKGDILATIDTGNMYNYFGVISPCARFIAASGFSSDGRVWSVEFDKEKKFKQVTRAFELKGHTSAILSVCFTADSTKLATASKDGTWRLWNINVDFKYQDPVFLKSGKYPYRSEGGQVHTALSTAGQCLLVAQGRAVHFVDTDLGEVVESVDQAHSDPVTAVAYEARHRLFLSAGGRHVNVFGDVAGRRADVRALRERLRRAGEDRGLKQVLSDQIRDEERAIEDVLARK